jgi:imidazolonepropionase-like amidohydrolase
MTPKFLIAAACMLGAVAAQDVAVKAAHVHTMTAAPVAAGAVVIRAGKIASIGAGDASAQDFGDAHVYPGMIDAATTAGARAEKDDASDLFMPGFRMQDAVDVRHRDFTRFAEAGVTTVHVLPGDRNVVGGTACAVKVPSTTLRRS